MERWPRHIGYRDVQFGSGRHIDRVDAGAEFVDQPQPRAAAQVIPRQRPQHMPHRIRPGRFTPSVWSSSSWHQRMSSQSASGATISSTISPGRKCASTLTTATTDDLVPEQAGLAERVDDRAELVDEFSRTQRDVTGQPGADRLGHPADHEVGERLGALRRRVAGCRVSTCWPDNMTNSASDSWRLRITAALDTWAPNISRPTRGSASMVRTMLAIPGPGLFLGGRGGHRRLGRRRQPGDDPVEHRADEIAPCRRNSHRSSGWPDRPAGRCPGRSVPRGRCCCPAVQGRLPAAGRDGGQPVGGIHAGIGPRLCHRDILTSRAGLAQYRETIVSRFRRRGAPW